MWRNGRKELGKASKLALARELIDLIAKSFAAARAGGAAQTAQA